MSLTIYLKQPACSHCGCSETWVHDQNITHNLNRMANECGLYQVLWKGDGKKCKDALPLLNKGLEELKKRPLYYSQFSAENGWGTYEQFVPWLERLKEAMVKYPETIIEVNS